MKSPYLLAALLGAAMAVGVACNSASTTNGDMATTKTDMAGMAILPDGAIPVDFANANECAPIETWCNSNTPCPKTWATAYKAETWCTAGVNARIYITKSQACDAGYFAVAYIDDTMDPPGRQYGYATASSGSLVSVGTYYPDDESGTFTCVAGPTDAPQAIASSCQYTMYTCVNGTLQ